MPDPQVWMEEVVRAARTRPRERRTRPAFSRDIPGAHATLPSHNIASERFLALHPGNLAGAHSKFARVLTGAHLPQPNEGAGSNHSRP